MSHGTERNSFLADSGQNMAEWGLGIRSGGPFRHGRVSLEAIGASQRTRAAALARGSPASLQRLRGAAAEDGRARGPAIEAF